MLFNSLGFLLIFPVIFIIYWLLPIKYHTIRKLFLIIVSYLLYANFNPVYTIVLFGVTLVTYTWGVKNETSRSKSLIWPFVIISFIPLLLFKYYNFFNDNVIASLSLLGLRLSLPGLNWAIPIGISFFTFQAIGYMLDVYYRKIKAEKDILDYMLFVSFFPQIASGPISKASELLPQIKHPHSFEYNQAVSGLRYLLWGMFLKVTLADRVGIYVDTVFNEYSNFSGVGCAIGSFMYSIQIYADFAGYSLMAVGLGKCLGFNLINNFNRPYFSVSITDFWRRWHISLSRWLKDYVYIPMGGSRCSKKRNAWNIFVTFFVSGIWHGANWTFIIWGIIHGLFQIVEKYFGWNKKKYHGFTKFFRIFTTFFIVTLAWTIFRSPSIEYALGYISHYIIPSGKLLAEGSVLIYVILAFIPLLIFEVLSEFFPFVFNRIYNKRIVRWITYIIIFTMIMLIGVYDGSSFIYVSF